MVTPKVIELHALSPYSSDAKVGPVRPGGQVKVPKASAEPRR